MSDRWVVHLPRGAEPPYRVFVSGVPQEEGRDYTLDGHSLVFTRPLRKERVGLGRWMLMFFAIAGSYGRHDSVDVHYMLGGRECLAVGLDIVGPDEDAR